MTQGSRLLITVDARDAKKDVDTFSQSLENVEKQGEKTSKSTKKTGESVKDAGDKFKDTSKQVGDLSGKLVKTTDAEKKHSSIISELIKEVSDYSKKLRETSASTQQLGSDTKSTTGVFGKFREQLSDTAGGSRFGSIISDTTNKMNTFRGGAGMAAAGLVGLAVGGFVLASGALTKMALDLAQADKQLAILAQRSNTSVEKFYSLSIAAESFGVNQEKLSDILADTQEKLGEFSATGAGEGADFFDALKNNTKMTEEQIKSFGKTLQGKDGIDAIIAINKELDTLDVTKQERRFVLESLASELGDLAPLLENNASLLREYEKALEDAGVKKTDESVEKSKMLAAQQKALELRFGALKDQLAVAVIPTVSKLLDYFVQGVTKGGNFELAISAVGKIAKATGVVIIGVAGAVEALITMMTSFAEQAKNIGQTAVNVWNADGMAMKGAALYVGLTKSIANSNTALVSLHSTIESTMSGWSSMIDDQVKSEDSLASVIAKTNDLQEEARKGLAIDTKTAEKNAKAKEAQAKATAELYKNQLKLDQLVSKGEGNYASYNQGKAGDSLNNPLGVDITAMTVAQIRAMQKDNGGLLFAVGKYQAIPSTLQDAIDKGVLQPFEKFTSEVQEKLFQDYLVAIKRPQVKKYITGQSNKLNIAHNALANEFASVPTTSGKGAYDGLAGNKASGSLANVQKTLQMSRKLYADAIAAGKSAEEAWDSVFSSQAQTVDQSIRSSAELANQQKTIVLQYMSDEQKAELEHRQYIQNIQIAFAKNPVALDTYVALETMRYEQSVDRFKKAEEEKTKKLQDELVERYNLVAQSYSAAQKIIQDYQVSLMPEYKQPLFNQNQIEQEGYAQLGNDFNKGINAINDDPLKTEEEKLQARLELQKKYQEAMAAQSAMYDKQQHEMTVASYSASFSAMATLLGKMVGENSGAYQTMFALSKAYYLGQAAMNVYKSASDAYANTQGTVWQKMAAAAMASLQSTSFVTLLEGVSGFYDGGYTGSGAKYTPAGIVHAGEVVWSQDDIKRWGGVGVVESMRTSSPGGYADGGVVDRDVRTVNAIQSQSGYGQSGGDVNVNITVNQDGSSSTDVQGGQQKAAADTLANGFRRIIMQECRQGGIIYNYVRTA